MQTTRACRWVVFGWLPLAMAAMLALSAHPGLAQPPVAAQQDRDWLLDAQPPATKVAQPGPQEWQITNGLIARRFRVVGQGIGTVALDNLITNEAVLRGVKPEAQIVLNGLPFDVGGLTGQPNYAFLTPEWEQQLQANPQSLELVAVTAQPIQPRLQWKRVRHAEDRPWPPPGQGLRLDFRPSKAMIATLMETLPRPSNEGREVLPTPPATVGRLSEAWSDDDLRRFRESGWLVGPANHAAGAVVQLPAGTRLVEALVDPGAEQSKTWGPGLALVWEGFAVKFNLRPGSLEDQPQYGVTINGQEQFLGSFDREQPQRLRLRQTDEAIYCEASPQAPVRWTVISKIPTERPLGDPREMRLGKLDRNGGNGSYAEPGPLGKCRLSEVRAFGRLNAELLADEQTQALDLANVTVSVHYEMYDGLPVYRKWIAVKNGSANPVTIDRLTCDLLAAVEYESGVEAQMIREPNIHVETDYAFGGFTPRQANAHVVHWVPDPQYETQVNYLRRTPCLLEVRPPRGPATPVAPGEVWESFSTFVLLYDSTERERQGLSLRRMYRVLAPWVTENPLMMHVRFADPQSVKAAIDQCAAVGFEMVILTFGSGFNIENESPAYLAQMKELADYAHERNVEIGGYSLLASRRIGPDGDNCIDPKTGQPGGGKFGFAPALASNWGQDYFRKLRQFYEKTGFDLLEHDGSYPGDFDAAARPPLQQGLEDSQWVQWRIITDYYKWCRARGVYLNVPDYYYMAGSNKCGMGYRETNWSLPRAQQIIHGRQNIYDGAWQKTPSMGWMFVPLTEYHGGGPAATIEPLSEHLDHYRQHLTNNLGLGVQACYRGPRLYDTETTRQLVSNWVAWYKKYRPILESDLIHGRRADGRDVDWMLHVNHQLSTRGMLLVYNPLSEEVTRTLRVPLYYTGLTERAAVRVGEGPREVVPLDAQATTTLHVTVPPQGMTWLVIEPADASDE